MPFGDCTVECMTTEAGTEQNVVKQLPTYAARHPSRPKVSITPLRKLDISQE